MIAQKPKKEPRGSGRTPAYKVDYALAVDNAPHNTPNMAAAWGRLAAVLNWDIEAYIAIEVAPECHEVARSAYNTAKERKAA